MTKLIETTVLKPHLAPHGVIVQRGETIYVDEKRHKALVKRGYVPDPDAPAEADGPASKEPGVITNKPFQPRRSKIIAKDAEE